MEVGAQAGTMMVSALRRAPIPSVGTCRPCTMRRSPLSPATIRSWYQVADQIRALGAEYLAGGRQLENRQQWVMTTVTRWARGLLRGDMARIIAQ